MPKKKRKRNPPHTWTDPKTGDLYALFTFLDPTGKRIYRYRKATSVANARDLYHEMKREYESRGAKVLDARHMTFNQLAEYAKEYYIKPPVYAGTRKVGGMRSWKDSRSKLKIICTYFGAWKIRDISHDDVKKFKETRAETPTQGGGDRKISTIHRELSCLRRVLNIARRRGWILINPFDGGELISSVEETERTRTLYLWEEDGLLMACADQRRRHLRAIIICGIETGMRKGEMFTLRWSDVHFELGTIHIRAFVTKDAEDRDVGITPRLRAELERLWDESPKRKDGLVFGVSSVKRSWKTACQIAGVKNATLHDLRHTAGTRMSQAGVPTEEIARILGHADVKTTYRYTNPTDTTATRAAQSLHEWRQSQHNEETDPVH